MAEHLGGRVAWGPPPAVTPGQTWSLSFSDNLLRNGFGQADWLEPLMEETGTLAVACGVRAEASVIAMMDLNVGYMCGPLFAEPKRLKAGETALAEAL